MRKKIRVDQQNGTLLSWEILMAWGKQNMQLHQIGALLWSCNETNVTSKKKMGFLCASRSLLVQ
jgi:hypothetical protein